MVGWFFLCLAIGLLVSLFSGSRRFLQGFLASNRGALLPIGLWILASVVAIWIAELLARAFYSIDVTTPSAGDVFLFLLLFIPGMAAGILVALRPLFTYLVWIPSGTIFAFLLPTLAFMLWQYIQYLTTRHPAEDVLDRRDQMPRQELVQQIADAMYDETRDGIPEEWVSKAHQRRAEAVRERIEAENDLMEEVIENLKRRERLGK